MNASDARWLKDGRVAFWHEQSRTVIVYNPRDPDLGTAYKLSGKKLSIDSASRCAMKIEKFGRGEITLQLSKGEIGILQASVREAIEVTWDWAEDKPLFQQKVGWKIEVAEVLLDGLTPLYRTLAGNVDASNDGGGNK